MNKVFEKFNLTGRAALITGAAGLLGVEHAAALLESGAIVVLTDINEASLAVARTTLLSNADSEFILTHVMDVSQPDSIRAVAKDLGAKGLRMDILVNNAAIDPKVKGDQGIVETSRLENFPIDQWDLQVAVGLTGAFLCSQVFGSAMAQDGKGGVILNIASDLSVFSPDQRLYREDGVADDMQPVKPVTYSVIKAGLIGLTRYLATYWADKGIRANALSPGGILNDQSEDFVQRLSALIPLARMAHYDEYRSVVQFLCSDASAYLNGQNIVMDGGSLSVVKRFLITTALEETWRDNEPVLFLGEWCRRYSRRDHWSKMDVEVLPYHWDDRAKLHADYKYVMEFYERLLCELSAQLNQIHGVKHSLRYWRILIGPWLGEFTQILFDRWTNLQLAISRYNISNTIVLTGQEDTLVPKDMLGFERFYFDDKWNHHIYGLLLQHYTNVSCTRVIQRGEGSEPKQVPASLWNGSFKCQLLFCYSRIVSVMTRDKDGFFLNTYLNSLDELKLCQRLGQVPLIWSPVTPVQVDVNNSQRQWTVAGKGCPDFEGCARALIPQQIPTIYLEGYEQLVEQVADVPWPKQPKLIWTSNAHFLHDVFKAWAAEKTECGSPLVIGQHGGHYGMGRWSFTEDHEMAISDYYLSWGWSDPDIPKIKPVGQFGVRKPLEVCHAEQTGLLMVTAVVPRQSYHMYSVMVSRQQVDYFDDQYCFVESLPDHIRGELTVRLYSMDYGWDQLARWRDKFPDICLDAGKANIKGLIRKSRLYIATYNSTTYLETFAMNVPTVIFWNPNHWELRDSAIPYFEDLKRVGIFHETPDSAARHVATIWDDVDAWWTSSAVRGVVENFKLRYCYFDGNLFDRIEDVFRDVVNTSKLSVASSSLFYECKPENKE